MNYNKLNKKYVWGVIPTKPIINKPDGRIRLRLRNDDFGKAYVKNNGTISEYIIEDLGENWSLVLIQGKNQTIV